MITEREEWIGDGGWSANYGCIYAAREGEGRSICGNAEGIWAFSNYGGAFERCDVEARRGDHVIVSEVDEMLFCGGNCWGICDYHGLTMIEFAAEYAVAEEDVALGGWFEADNVGFTGGGVVASADEGRVFNGDEAFGGTAGGLYADYAVEGIHASAVGHCPADRPESAVENAGIAVVVEADVV